MIDNKPLELEALNYITSRVNKYSKGKYYYSNPNCDVNGGDFQIEQENTVDNEKYNKIIKCQSKGRDITKKGSSVVLPESYVKSDFLLFIYLRTDDETRDLFLYTPQDIVNTWTLKNKKYRLNIPVNFPSLEENSPFVFNKSRATCIFDTLDNMGPDQLTYLEDSMIVEFLYKLWKKSGGLPNYDSIKYINDNEESIVPYFYTRHLLFLVCAIIIANDSDNFSLNVDWAFYPLSINTAKLNIKINEEGTDYSRANCVSYKSRVSEVSYMNGDIKVYGYHLNMHDSEEEVNGFIFRDGLYSVEHRLK